MVLRVHSLEIGFRSTRRAGAHVFGGLRILGLQRLGSRFRIWHVTFRIDSWFGIDDSRTDDVGLRV